MQGMFTRILRNLLEDSGECYHFNILGNVQEEFGELFVCLFVCLVYLTSVNFFKFFLRGFILFHAG